MKNLLTFILSVLSFTCFVSNVQAQVIEGKVYIDFNANGQLDTTEYGFGGVQIYLYEGCQTNSPILDSIRTDSVGTYQFNNLPLGTYSVKVNKSDPKSPTSSSSPSSCCLELISTSSKERCNFGYPPPTCTSNPFSVDNLCEMAYANPLCDLRVIGDFGCGQNPSILGPWKDSLHCGGKFQNTSFYGFVAGRGNYQIEFTVSDCAGTGLQFGLMDSCNPSGPYAECVGSSNGDGVTVIIDASRLITGKTYIFWLDGYQGSVCAYYIQVIGDFNYFEIPDVNDIKIQGLSENECNPAGFYNVNFDLEPSYTFAKENVSAFWEVKSPDGVIEKFTTYTDRFDTLSYNFTQTGSYEICVYTDNSCSLVGNYFCKEFEINVIENDKKSIKICESSFPWSVEIDATGNPVLDKHGNPWRWLGGEITIEQVQNGQSTFYSTYYTPDSCAYIQEFEVVLVNQVQIPLIFCAESLLTSVTFAWSNMECVDEFDIYINGIFVQRQKELFYEARDLDVGGIVTIEVEAISNCQCPNARTSHTCAAHDCPPFPPFSVERQDFCLSEGKVTLIAKDIFNSNDNFLVKWSGIGVDSVGVFDPNLAGVGSHEITLTVVVLDVCYYFSKVFINVYDATVGDTCDDQDSTTINDVIQPDCTCKGEKVSSTHDFKDFGLSIIPNPSKDKFIIKSLLNENVEIKVVNINGQFCTNINKFVLNENQIDVSTWASGMYYILVKTKNDVTALKFIKVE